MLNHTQSLNRIFLECQCLSTVTIKKLDLENAGGLSYGTEAAEQAYLADKCESGKLDLRVGISAPQR